MSSHHKPVIAGLLLLLVACGGGGGGGSSSNSTNNNVVGVGPGGGGGPTQQELEALGKKLFEDTDLSTPPGQSCATCHDSASGFADPDFLVPVSEGAVTGRLGTRNSPTVSYAAFIPLLSQTNNGGIITSRGGQFLDGREPRLEEQAQQPFLNQIEMNMADRTAVVTAIMSATYADDFKAAYGDDVFNDVDDAYVKMSQAIAAFERSDEVSPFTSKFDRVQANLETFTPQEQDGLDVFNAVNCVRCHSGLIFSNFEYENIGVPPNPFVRANSLDSNAVPVDPINFVDNGLGGFTGDPDDNGKFRVPTLRNVAVTGPYMHNGVFDTLAEVISFYNARDPALAEVPGTVTNQDVGVLGGVTLGMSPTDMTNLEAFLNTLTD